MHTVDFHNRKTNRNGTKVNGFEITYLWLRLAMDDTYEHRFLTFPRIDHIIFNAYFRRICFNRKLKGKDDTIRNVCKDQTLCVFSDDKQKKIMLPQLKRSFTSINRKTSRILSLLLLVKKNPSKGLHCCKVRPFCPNCTTDLK